jgi:hypothetical protein
MVDDYAERIDVLQDDPHYPAGTLRLFIRWVPAGGRPISGVYYVFPEEQTDTLARASALAHARQSLCTSMSMERDGQCPPGLETMDEGTR